MKKIFDSAARKKDVLLGKLHNNGIYTFWFNSVPNAGDLVTPFILKQYGLRPILTDPRHALLLSCGSIMQRIDENFSQYVIGSGFLNDGDSINLRNAHILAVRGKFTRDRIFGNKNIPLGDPGLLMGNYLEKREKKRFLFGIVPHYEEKKHPFLFQFLKSNPGKVIVIDIQTNPLEVVRKIDQCEYILSSSLHGNVFADSLGIPNIWISLSNLNTSKRYKFNDYYSAFGLENMLPLHLDSTISVSQIISKLIIAPKEKVNDIKGQLSNAYRVFIKKIRE